MNDDEIEKILGETDQIEQLLRDSGDIGYKFAASLFRLAVYDQREIPTACESAARAYTEIMQDMLEARNDD